MYRSKVRRSGESGFAVIIVLVLIVIVMFLGSSLLLMSETENRIAQNERVSLQALYTAESGVEMVKRWFDRPGYASNLINPGVAVIDRSLRLIDVDGDPSTPPVAADGSAGRPYYKQGVDEDGDGVDDLFHQPFRGSLADTLLGTENGPDMRIDAASSTAARTFLDQMSAALLADYPGPSSDVAARISRIDVYAPPYVQSGGSWVRFGIATIDVIAGVYRRVPGHADQTLGERRVRIVLSEIPYSLGGLEGPLHSCGNLNWNGEFSVHWGISTAMGTTDLHNNHEKWPVGWPRAAVADAEHDLLWGFDDDIAFADYKAAADGVRIEDPWSRLVSAGPLADAPNNNAQPFPFNWTPGTPLADGEIPLHPGGHGGTSFPSEWDGTHSNLLQNQSGVTCPDYDYQFWKRIAVEGAPGVHYYTWDSGDSFRENGVGPARSFRDITNAQVGYFFFDTRDGLEPRDDNGDGLFDNLTPSIRISGGRWGVRGMIYLNAVSFQATGIRGRPTTFNAPGEPFQDRNQNGRFDAGENWVNLSYPTTLNGRFVIDESDHMQQDGTNGGIAVRNSRGPDVQGDAILWGILYNSGFYDSTGNGVYYGMVVSRQGVGEFSPSSGNPEHYWDDRLTQNWPPSSWLLPRVTVARWETDP